MNRTKTLCISIFMLSMLHASATNYYVDTVTGNSSNSGTTEGNAWDSLYTVSQKSSTFQPGDIISFKRGQRFYSLVNGMLSCSGTSISPITITGYGDTNAPMPILTVGRRIDTDPTWTDLGDGRYLYTGYTGSVADLLWEDGEPIKMAEDSTLTNGYWHLVAGTGIYIRPGDGREYGKHEYYLANNSIVFGINNQSYINFLNLSFEYTGTPITNGGSSTNATHDIRVENCNFSKASTCIWLNSMSTNLENSNITVINNKFTDIRFAFKCTGMNGPPRHHNLNISSNIIRRLAVRGAYVLNDGSPDIEAFSFQNINNCTIQGNIISEGVKAAEGFVNGDGEPLDSNGISIWNHGDSLLSNVIIADNRISNLGRGIIFGAGIGYFLQTNLMERNTIQNCTTGFRLNSGSYTGQETIIRHNSMIYNDVAVNLFSGGRGYQIISNSIFSSKQYHIRMDQAWQLTDSVIDYNIYYGDGPLWWAPYTTYNNLSDWQSTGQDTNSVTISRGFPFAETFETIPSDMAGKPGPVSGQHGWVGNPINSAIIQAEEAEEGNQSCSMKSGALNLDYFNPSSNVWIKLHLRMQPKKHFKSPPDTATAIFWVHPDGRLRAYDGASVITLETSSISSNVWTHFNINCDYQTQTWLLFQGTNMVAEDLAFYSSNRDHFQSLQIIENSSGNKSYIDDVLLTEDIIDIFPLDTDGDGIPDTGDHDDDNDGIPDDWEILHAMDPLDYADATLHYDTDGLNNLAEYIAGTDPCNALSTFAIVALTNDPAGVILYFDTSTGRLYAVDGNINIQSTNGWQDLTNHIPGSGSQTSLRMPPQQKSFYRLRVNLE